MNAEVRHRLVARARAWVEEIVQREDGLWPAAASLLLHSLDEACRAKLNAGRPDLFGSIADLRPLWDASLGTHLPADAEPELADTAFSATLDRLEAEGDLVFVSDRQRARSRFFETVHYMRHLRQRTVRHPGIWEAPPLVEMVKAEAKVRERPDRRRTVEELRERFEDVVREIDSEMRPLAPSDDLLDEAEDIFNGFLERAFGSRSLADFQLKALEAILAASMFAAQEGTGGPQPTTGVAIAAGTGFGKTEAFLLPVMFQALVTKLVRVRTRRRGVAAILLYPRRDLCNDQADRLLGYLRHLNEALHDRWSGIFGDVPFDPVRLALAHGGMRDRMRVACPLCRAEKEQSGAVWTADDERSAQLVAQPVQGQDLTGLFHCERAGIRHRAAAEAIAYQVHRQSEDTEIVVTNLDTMHRRLMDNHGRERLFGNGALPPRIVVLDEMHIYEGQSGTHAANIVRRLRHRIRAMPAADGLNPIVVGASATVHDPADLLSRLSGIRVETISVIEPSEGEKTRSGLEYFLFLQAPGNRLLRVGADDPDEDMEESGVTHRFVSEQATMIQAAMCLQHTMKAPDGDGRRKRRVLGFIDSLDVAARFARNLDDAEWQGAGPSASGRPVEMVKPPLFAFRLPSGRPDRPSVPERLRQQIAAAANAIRPGQAPAIRFATPGQDCPCFETRNCRQAPHHLLAPCARYEAGECWHHMGLEHEEGLRPIAIQKHQSGRRDWASPSLRWRDDDSDSWRLLVSTSALEVGFDHPELIATWQYHAPPSVAGFLQRKGRGGRGIADRPITMMVLGAGDADVFAFQHHDRYVNVDEARDLVCWIDPGNPSLRRQHAVAAIFDYCASKGQATAYSLVDLAKVDNVLATAPRRNEVARWVRSCFPDLTPAEAAGIVDEFATLLSQWVQPILPLNVGAAERTPHQLFASCDAARLRELAQHLTPQTDIESIRAREWLLALAAGRGDKQLVTAPDFFAALPPFALPDPDFRLPAGTISEPLGREVTLIGPQGTEIGRDAAEFALRSFLPGGFKIRFSNRLWAAPWHPPAGWRAPDGSLVSRASLVVQEPGGPASGTPDLIAREARQNADVFLQSATDLDAARCTEITELLGAAAQMVAVRALRLNDLGSPKQRSFTLDCATNAVRLSGRDAAGDTLKLSRDPHLTPQSLVVPLRPHDSEVLLAVPPFAAVRFHRRQPLALLHFANLVHCYPADGGERTVAVHFHAADRPEVPLVPAVFMRTEAVEFIPDPTYGQELVRPAKALAFWRRVASRLVAELVVRRGALPSAYMVDGCLEALEALEAHAGEFADSPPAAVDLLQRFDHTQAELEVLRPHLHHVAAVLAEASDWVSATGQRRVLADTLAQAILRAGADALRLSPLAFRTLVEPSGDGWRILIYDDNEGGNGNTRRLREELAHWTDLEARIMAVADCPVADADARIAAVLDGRLSADRLAFLASQQELGELLGTGAEPAARRRLGRLLDSPEAAAFNLYARDLVRRESAVFGGTPPVRRLLWASEAPALDPRAELLRKSFRSGGAPEITSRLRAVMPLCEFGCPYCIGSTDSFADRRTLRAEAGE